MSDPAVTKTRTAVTDWLHSIGPGASVAVVVALASAFVADRYGAPRMLMALLFGLSLTFLYENDQLRAGLDLVAKTGLKIGVALLGLRIALDPMLELGGPILALTLGCCGATLGLGWLLGRALKLERAVTIIASGAVAICGASAALALAAVTMGAHSQSKQTVTVITVATVLSTVAMVLYPVGLDALGLSDFQTGVVLGATIHDVAQVVGSGYSVSTEAGDTATLVKLIRVAFLPVVLLVVAASLGSRAEGVALPWFVWAFALCVCLRLFLPLPPVVLSAGETLSSGLLVMSVAALGMSSSPKLIARTGGPVLALMGSLTVVLFAVATLVVSLFLPG